MPSDYGGIDTIVPGRLRTFRLWRINPYEMKITALNRTDWPIDKPLKAECRNRVYATDIAGHAVPSSACTCGIYSRYDPNDLYDLAQHGKYPEDIFVVGALSNFGAIELGTRGCRSQYGMIEALAPVSNLNWEITLGTDNVMESQEIIRQVVSSYHVRLYKNLTDLTHDFPKEDLSALGIQQAREKQVDKAAMNSLAMISSMPASAITSIIESVTKAAENISRQFAGNYYFSIDPATGSMSRTYQILANSSYLYYTPNQPPFNPYIGA